MDRSAVQDIVEAEIEGMMESLGIAHWKIDVGYGRAGGSRWAAEVENLIDYNKASITIDHDTIEDEEDCRRVLRHELLHVVLSPFDLYRDLVGLARFAEGEDNEQTRHEQRAWTHAVEKGVKNLERMCFQFDRMLREARQKKGGRRCSSDS